MVALVAVPALSLVLAEVTLIALHALVVAGRPGRRVRSLLRLSAAFARSIQTLSRLRPECEMHWDGFLAGVTLHRFCAIRGV